MPVVTIEIRKQYPAEYEIQLIDAVHSALLVAFKILPTDKNVRLLVHEPHRFTVPPNCQFPELYTYIAIDCFAGRSLDAKRNLYQTIVHNLEKLGIPKDHVKILLREISRENLGIRGGQASCDIELDFKINV